jgi:hypothetical protein
VDFDGVADGKFACFGLELLGFDFLGDGHKLNSICVITIGSNNL